MSQYHVEHQDATDKNKNSMLTSFTHIACIQQIMTYVHININVCSYSTLIIREIVKIYFLYKKPLVLGRAFSRHCVVSIL